MRRLLIVAMDYPPMPYGIAEYSASLAGAISAMGIEVTVLALAGDGDAAYDKTRPYRTIRASPLPGLGVPSIALKFLHLCRRGNFDAVWHTVWTSSLFSHMFRPIAPVPFYISAHASDVLDDTLTWRRRFKYWLRPMKLRAMKNAEAIFALSRYTAERLREMGAPEQRVRIATGGVDPVRFSPRPNPAFSSPPILITVARLDLHKGHDRVLEALALLRDKGRTVRYRLCGGGDEEHRLKGLVVRLGLESTIEFLDWLPPERLPKVLRESDIFIMPSREIPGRLDLIEGLGLAFLEASACGLPVIGGRSGGVPDAIQDGVTGFLVNPDDPKAIAAAIERLIDDPALARRMGEAGRRFAEQDVAWPKMAEKIVRTMKSGAAACR